MTSASNDADLKGSIFTRTIYPPCFIVKANGGGSTNRPPPVCIESWLLCYPKEVPTADIEWRWNRLYQACLNRSVACGHLLYFLSSLQEGKRKCLLIPLHSCPGYARSLVVLLMYTQLDLLKISTSCIYPARKRYHEYPRKSQIPGLKFVVSVSAGSRSARRVCFFLSARRLGRGKMLELRESSNTLQRAKINLKKINERKKERNKQSQTRSTLQAIEFHVP